MLGKGKCIYNMSFSCIFPGGIHVYVAGGHSAAAKSLIHLFIIMLVWFAQCGTSNLIPPISSLCINLITESDKVISNVSFALASCKQLEQ